MVHNSSKYRERYQSADWWKQRLLKTMASTASQCRAGVTKQKGRIIERTIDQSYLQTLWEAQGGRCYFSKVRMCKEPGRLKSVSIDRLDASLGYVPGNVALVALGINCARTRQSSAEMMEFICEIVSSHS